MPLVLAVAAGLVVGAFVLWLFATIVGALWGLFSDAPSPFDQR